MSERLASWFFSKVLSGRNLREELEEEKKRRERKIAECEVVGDPGIDDRCAFLSAT